VFVLGRICSRGKAHSSDEGGESWCQPLYAVDSTSAEVPRIRPNGGLFAQPASEQPQPLVSFFWPYRVARLRRELVFPASPFKAVTIKSYLCGKPV
jgi:hypothetical protein